MEALKQEEEEKARLAAEEERRRRRHERKKQERMERELELEKERSAESSDRKGKSKERNADRPRTRDAARREAEEEPDYPPQTPTFLRPSSHRHAGSGERTRDSSPSQKSKRASLFGGIFGRSRTESSVPTIKRSTSSPRDKSEPSDSHPTVRRHAKEKVRPTSSMQSSGDSHGERKERPHDHRRDSQSHQHRRRFETAEEEAEYRAKKEERRAARAAAKREQEMVDAFGGPTPGFAGEGSRSLDAEQLPSFAVTVESTSSADRQVKRSSRRVSGAERPRTARTESDRPRSSRIEERPRTSHRESHRESYREPHRESERARSRKDESGVKNFLTGLKKIVA